MRISFEGTSSLLIQEDLGEKYIQTN